MKKLSLPFLAGLVLIVGSLCFLLVFRLQTAAGARACRTAAAQMQEMLSERTAGVPGMYPDAAMPVLEISGTDYCALLEIPAFGIALPVADRWDGKDLHTAPRRFCGSAYDHTLVVGGSDAPQQFAFCGQIDIGALVTLTDMTGVQFSYTVSRVDRADSAQTAWLQDGDLVLFCREAYGFGYIAVRCVFSGK